MEKPKNTFHLVWSFSAKGTLIEREREMETLGTIGCMVILDNYYI